MNLFVKFIKFVFRFYLGIFYREVDIVGKENVPPSGPCIFVGNHQNQVLFGTLFLLLKNSSVVCGRCHALWILQKGCWFLDGSKIIWEVYCGKACKVDSSHSGDKIC